MHKKIMMKNHNKAGSYAGGPQPWRPPLQGRFQRILIFMAAGLGLVLVSGGFLVFLGGRDILINTDVGVVLGNAVYRNGQPCPRLAARLNKSLALYQSGRLKTIIVSGGMGWNGVDEATAMGAYLQARGVKAKDIVIDSKGINTWNTALFTADWLKKNGRDGVIVISQHFHVPRSALAMKAAGCARVGQASPDYWERADFYSIAREIPANLVYWWRYSRPSKN